MNPIGKVIVKYILINLVTAFFLYVCEFFILSGCSSQDVTLLQSNFKMLICLVYLIVNISAYVISLLHKILKLFSSLTTTPSV